MNEFLDRMSEVLEEPVTPETRFRELAGYSSLKGFGLLVALENDFGRAMDIAEFMSMETIGDLAAAAGVARALPDDPRRWRRRTSV